MDASPDACREAFLELNDLALKLAPPHRPVDNLPQDPDEMWTYLQGWMSADTRPVWRSLPVWSGGCLNTIYPGAEGNYAFRAWHDSLHLAMGEGFDREGEHRVALAHVRLARMHGCSELACAALWADTWGQFLYGEAHAGAFVEDQQSFVLACLQGNRAGVDYRRIDSAIEDVIATGETY